MPNQQKFNNLNLASNSQKIDYLENQNAYQALEVATHLNGTAASKCAQSRNGLAQWESLVSPMNLDQFELELLESYYGDQLKNAATKIELDHLREVAKRTNRYSSSPQRSR